MNIANVPFLPKDVSAFTKRLREKINNWPRPERDKITVGNISTLVKNDPLLEVFANIAVSRGEQSRPYFLLYEQAINELKTHGREEAPNLLNAVNALT